MIFAEQKECDVTNALRQAPLLNSMGIHAYIVEFEGEVACVDYFAIKQHTILEVCRADSHA